MQDIITMLEPFLLETVVSVFAAFAYRLLGGRVAQDTLHRAIETGAYAAASMLEDGRITPDEVLDFIASYVEKSSPGAVKKLKPSRDVLQNLARAKFAKVLTRGAQ